MVPSTNRAVVHSAVFLPILCPYASQALGTQPASIGAASLPPCRPSVRAATVRRRRARQPSDVLSSVPAVQSSSSRPLHRSRSGSTHSHRTAHKAKAVTVRGRQSVWRHLIAGGLAGAASRTATAPLETLRLRMMVASSRGLGLAQACQQIWAEAGWRAFFRGNALNVSRSEEVGGVAGGRGWRAKKKD